MTDTRGIENALGRIADQLAHINLNLDKMNKFIEAYDINNPEFNNTIKTIATAMVELQETL